MDSNQSPAAIGPLPDQSLAWPIVWPGIVLLATLEGLRLIAYQCQAGVWTYGWGETAGVHQGMTITKADADARLCEQLIAYTNAVKGMLTRPANDYELAGMVVFAYNVGLRDDAKKAGFYYSSVRRLFNAGDISGAARAFGLQNEYTDAVTHKRVVSPGLTARRKKEAALFVTPDPNEVGSESMDMPQEVAPESSMAKSPIGIGGAATATAGAASLLNSASDKVNTVSDTIGTATSTVQTAHGALSGVHEFLASFGFTVPEVLGAAVLIAGVVIVYYRWKQRTNGWA